MSAQKYLFKVAVAAHSSGDGAEIYRVTATTSRAALLRAYDLAVAAENPPEPQHLAIVSSEVVK